MLRPSGLCQPAPGSHVTDSALWAEMLIWSVSGWDSSVRVQARVHREGFTMPPCFNALPTLAQTWDLVLENLNCPGCLCYPGKDSVCGSWLPKIVLQSFECKCLMLEHSVAGSQINKFRSINAAGFYMQNSECLVSVKWFYLRHSENSWTELSSSLSKELWVVVQRL